MKPSFLKEDPITIQPAYIKAKPFYPKNYRSNNKILYEDTYKGQQGFKPNLRKMTIIFLFSLNPPI